MPFDHVAPETHSIPQSEVKPVYRKKLLTAMSQNKGWRRGVILDPRKRWKMPASRFKPGSRPRGCRNSLPSRRACLQRLKLGF